MKDTSILTNNGINVQTSLDLLGDMEMYDETLGEFLDMTDDKISALETHLQANDMPNYAIDIHALKSDSKYLGFATLADLSYESEMKAKANDSVFVAENHSKILQEAKRVINLCQQYMGREITQVIPEASSAPAATPAVTPAVEAAPVQTGVVAQVVEATPAVTPAVQAAPVQTEVVGQVVEATPAVTPVVQAAPVQTEVVAPVAETASVVTPVVQAAPVQTETVAQVAETASVVTPVVQAVPVQTETVTQVVETTPAVTPVVQAAPVQTEVVAQAAETTPAVTPVVQAAPVQTEVASQVVEATPAVTPVVQAASVQTEVASQVVGATPVVTPVVESAPVAENTVINSNSIQFFPADNYGYDPMSQALYMQQQTQQSVSQVAAVKKGIILVVDDSPLVSNFVKKIFSSSYDVMIASDGQKAINIINDDNIRSQIKTCLLDLNMPNVNGFDVMDYFKEKGFFVRTPVAIISGAEDIESLDKAKGYPIVDVLPKPFNERDVQRVVEKCLAVYF